MAQSRLHRRLVRSQHLGSWSRLASKRPQAACWDSNRREEQHRGRGIGHPGRLGCTRRRTGRRRRTRGCFAQGLRGRYRWHHKHERTRLRVHWEERDVRRRAEPVVQRPHERRIIEWIGGSRRHGLCPRGPWHRYQRLDPSSCCPVWDLGSQTDHGSSVIGRHRSVGADSRHRRTPGGHSRPSHRGCQSDRPIAEHGDRGRPARRSDDWRVPERLGPARGRHRRRTRCPSHGGPKADRRAARRSWTRRCAADHSGGGCCRPHRPALSPIREDRSTDPAQTSCRGPRSRPPLRSSPARPRQNASPPPLGNG